MGYWKCGIDFYMSPIMRDIVKPIHPRDGFMPARESIFFKLLSYSASNHEFWTAKEFSNLTNSPLKQCEIVWDICIKHGILKQESNGYSARRWLKKQDLLCDEKDKQQITKEIETQENESSQKNEQQKEVENPIETPKEINTSIPSPNNKENHQKVKQPSKDNTKIAARPNVYLTYGEINNLKCEFSDEEITLMLDHLSEYKMQNHRNYASDYQAIRRWVIKWLDTVHRSRHTNNNQTKSENVNSEFPSWLTGK